MLEGLPGVLGNKGTLAKYRREQGNISQFLGTGEQNSKNYSTKIFWESVGTWKHRAILEGNKGTRTLPPRETLMLEVSKTTFKIFISFKKYQRLSCYGKESKSCMIWLPPRAGKMKRILITDWLPNIPKLFKTIKVSLPYTYCITYWLPLST